MFKSTLYSFFVCSFVLVLLSFTQNDKENQYTQLYQHKLDRFVDAEQQLLNTISQTNLQSEASVQQLLNQLQLTRNQLKGMDFWFRYLDPLSHKKINGPLPVEWETEVFEKFEKPYKRNGAGLTLAYQYLTENPTDIMVVKQLIQQSVDVLPSYRHDSITSLLTSYHHFYLCNRLYILNLATIYTSGFDCPNAEQIIPELLVMLRETQTLYETFDLSFPSTPLTQSYLNLYQQAIDFVEQQPRDYTLFDHYTFIRSYVNPLFALNQELILKYRVVSKSMVDYSLSKQATSIFSKNLYFGQHTKGVYYRVQDAAILAEVEELGRQLFFDPILSGNNQRSCASCHIPGQGFTDTIGATADAFNHASKLARNTPTLLNSPFNHLLMADGQFYTLQLQAKGVITNPHEMNCKEAEMLNKVLSCKTYKKGFEKLLPYTPLESNITTDHIVSALTYYYSTFSQYASPFDDAMNQKRNISKEVQIGFNLFMGKAQCGTCHFAPQFNGVKPPYIGSEFEVLGVPADTQYTSLSKDQGRYTINPSDETMRAFRTGTVRNAGITHPYMHNGVFQTLEQVIDFYDGGGGAGRGLNVPNQTLSADSLHLTEPEKKQLILFIHSLTETVPMAIPPTTLPPSTFKQLNSRVVGGLY